MSIVPFSIHSSAISKSQLDLSSAAEVEKVTAVAEGIYDEVVQFNFSQTYCCFDQFDEIIDKQYPKIGKKRSKIIKVCRI